MAKEIAWENELDQAARLACELPKIGFSKRFETLLEKDLPSFSKELETIAQCPSVFSWWGQSFNYDENASLRIVRPEILVALAERCNTAAWRRETGNAGLLHTYGYLLSLIETPFGKKRLRWLRPTIERGLKIRRRLLRFQPESGTLLGNVTYLLAHIAFREQPKCLSMLRRIAPCVSPRLLEYPFEDLNIDRRIETVVHPKGKDAGTLELVSDLVCFRYSRQPQKPKRLLVYSVGESRGKRKLVTAFPVTYSFASTLLDKDAGSELLRRRYNAHIAGYSKKDLKGNVRIERNH